MHAFKLYMDQGRGMVDNLDKFGGTLETEI
jgi:hypothetical protein